MPVPQPPPQPAGTRPVLPPWPVAGAFVLGCALAAASAPLLTYSLSLALFGGAHVLTELRFVEARFSARLGARLRWGIGVLLAGVVVLRTAGNLGDTGPLPPLQVELLLVAGLGAAVLPTLAQHGGRALAVGVAVVGAVGAGLVAAPVWTMLVLACLHNWTPVGFVAEGLPAAERMQGRAMGLLVFVGAPAVLASGLPVAVLNQLGARWPDLTLLPTGPLAENLSAYLHPSVHGSSWAVPAFSALVFVQCMHYATVLGVLPRMAPGGPDAPSATGLSRIQTPAFVLGVAVLTVLSFVGFSLDFAGTRGWYGVAAAVHAWVEVPLLLVALVPANPTVAEPLEAAGPPQSLQRWPSS